VLKMLITGQIRITLTFTRAAALCQEDPERATRHRQCEQFFALGSAEDAYQMQLTKES